MRRRTTVAFAILASILVATTVPVSASHSPAISIHTTDSDFNNAAVLDNVDVVGSGNAASVDVRETPITIYNVVDDSGDGTRDDDRRFLGDTGGDGTWSTELKIKPTDSGPLHGLTINTTTQSGSDYGFVVDVFLVGENPDDVYGEGTLIANNWDPDFTDGEQTIPIDTVVDVTAGANHTLEFVTQSTDNDGNSDKIGVSVDTSFSTTWYTSNKVSGSGDAGGDVTTDIGYQDGQYVGANHSVTHPDTGFTNITLSDANATVEWQFWDGSQWVVDSTSTFTTGGNKSISLTSASDKWRTNVSFHDLDGASPTATLEDEGVQAHASPSFNNSSASPSGGEQVTSESVTLSIDVSDADFPTDEGDSVTVEFFVNGSSVGTDTLTSNGTASVSTSETTGGTNQWHAEATDDYSHTQSSDTFIFERPGELKVLNETAVNQSNSNVLVDEVKVHAEFYFQESGDIIVKNTTDGTIDMSGLPANEPFVVVLEAEGYHNRRIYVDALFQNQRVYLLPESVRSVESTFVLEDFSGDFPSDVTVLKVQRALADGTGDTTWQTVEGDFFGGTGEFPAHLRYNTRHRLILLNTDTGQRRNASIFIPVQDGEQTIRVLETGEITVGEGDSAFTFGPSIRQLPAINETTVGVQAVNRTTGIDEYTVTVTYRNETSTVELTNATIQGDTDFSADLDLRNKSGGNVTVSVDYTLADGTTGATSAEYTVIQHFANEHSLVSIMGGITSDQIPAKNVGTFTSLISVLASLFVAGTVATSFRASTEAIGLVVIATLAGFAILDWFAYQYLFAIIVTWLGFAAVRRGL